MPSLFKLSRDGDADELLRLLQESESGAVRRHAIELLADVEVDPEEESKIVDALVRAAAGDGDDGIRAAAIDALDQRDAVDQFIAVALGRDPASEGANWARAETFARGLQAGRPEMRMASAIVLGHLGNPAATSGLVERLSDSDPRVRARSARAIGRIGDPRGASALRARLRDPDIDVRREVAEAIARIGGKDALIALTPMLDDSSESVRHIAASSLGKFPSTRPLTVLVHALNDTSPAVRTASVLSIVEILSEAPLERVTGLRKLVLRSLQSTDDRSIADALGSILEEGTQERQRRNATWLLRSISGAENQQAIIGPLVEALEGEEMTAQFAAATLTSYDESLVEKRLLSFLDELEVEIDGMARAVRVLGKVGGPDAAKQVRQLAEADSTPVRVKKTAQKAYVRMKQRGAVDKFSN